MKKITTCALAVFTATIAISPIIEAKTVLSAKERCFEILEVQNSRWFESLKIKPQQALTNKNGAIIEIVGLVHGRLNVNPTIKYYNQLAGAASYISTAIDNNQVVGNIVQVALVGTSYGTDTGTVWGISGLWSLNYTLMLEPEKKGKIPGGRLVGVKGFKAIGNGHDGDPATQTLVDEAVTEVPCSIF